MHICCCFYFYYCLCFVVIVVIVSGLARYIFRDKGTAVHMLLILFSLLIFFCCHHRYFHMTVVIYFVHICCCFYFDYCFCFVVIVVIVSGPARYIFRGKGTAVQPVSPSIKYSDPSSPPPFSQSYYPFSSFFLFIIILSLLTFIFS